jgi:glycosyltransferase involved in cell wall biosynthesis
LAKILFALHEFFPRFYTGTETLSLEVAKELQARGHDVSILCVEPDTHDIPYPAEPELRHDCYDGVPVWRFFTGSETGLLERLEWESYDNRLIPLIDDFLLREKPDIVHAFHLMRLTLSFAELVKKNGIPFYFTPTDFWLLCPTYQLLRYNGTLCTTPDKRSCFQCLLATYMQGLADKPLKLRLALAFPRVAGLFNPTVRSCQRILESRIERNHRLMDLIDRVFWSNDFIQNMFTENKYKPKNHKTIKFPVPQQANSLFNLPLAEVSSVLRVAFIGTLNPSKGPQVAIKAVRKLKPQVPVELSIWGAAPRFEFEQELKKLAKDDSRIMFRGTFPQNKFSEVLKDIDVLVIPSLWYENTPLVALSSLAARRVIIVSNLGGLISLVENGRNGYIFPPGDASTLSRILLRLAQNKSKLSDVVKNINPPHRVVDYVEELIPFYGEVIQKFSGDGHE